MQKFDSSNTMFSLAADLVNHTARNIFLTGKAGTGKTTFLKYIRQHCTKKMAVVAPTGVAAINAMGVTIHSFFQLPFTPFLPEVQPFGNISGEVATKHNLLSRLRLNSERRKVFQELELLIIDEVSMVRCDTIDAIDTVLRFVRNKPEEKFGGVQLLFIGDMFQLPPVAKDAEWSLLRTCYISPYFFDSLALKDEPPVYIEFNKIYRQTEAKFISLLNQVRTNQMTTASLDVLHERYLPDFYQSRSDGYILLTTHNEKARSINTAELERIKSKMFVYDAEVENDFPSNAYPADQQLQLKIGAQVMFIKNDPDKAKRYFNGKIGKVTDLSADKIVVVCKDDSEPIEVKREKWENIRYIMNQATRNLDEDVLGSFNQYPLRLAWAITIHKSQGLTFEKAVIDAADAFAPGQLYVALSRCTSFEGMVLHNKVRTSGILTNDRIVQFSNSRPSLDDLKEELDKAKKQYEQKLIFSLFDYKEIVTAISEWYVYYLANKTAYRPDCTPWYDGLSTTALQMQTTAEKFWQQLSVLVTQASNGAGLMNLRQRLAAAAGYFSVELKKVIAAVQSFPASTDSRMQAKECNDLLREIFALSSYALFMLDVLQDEFTSEAYHEKKNAFVVANLGINVYAGSKESKTELAHPSLFYQLKKLRDTICNRKNIPIYLVASGSMLEEMTTRLPLTKTALENIKGFGKAKVASYGEDFLSVIREYCAENGLASNMGTEVKPQRKEKKTSADRPDTKKETLQLFKQGNSIAEIAAYRKLSPQTVEGHLAHFIQAGDISIEDLVSREKIILIEPALKDYTGSLSSVKEKLGDDISYGDIRLVLASVLYQNESAAHKDQ